MIQFLETASATSAGNLITLVLPMVIVIVFMYLILYLPQRRQEKKDTEMRNSIDVGDEVVTIGGIVGKIVRIKEDRILMETGTSKMKIEILKSAVGSVVGKKAEEKAAEAKDQKAEEEEKPAPRRDKKVTPKKLGGEKTEKAEKAEEAEAPAAEEEPKAE